MKYKGSKLRHRKQILEAITTKLTHLDLSTYNYWEPFVGGGNMIGYVNSQRLFKQCYGTDIDPDVIAYLAAAEAGWVPPEEISREMYETARANPEALYRPLAGYLAFSVSFGGMKWGSYAINKRGDDYVGQAWRRHQRDAQEWAGVKFENASFLDVAPEANTVIYCDPPYDGTSSYGAYWDQGAYVEWVKGLSQPVFMSAYVNPLPGLATEIWSKPVRVSLSANDNTKKTVERLFYVEP